jgi:uncharacterized DUF497 family protein
MTGMIFDWDDANRRHIARHNILPEEFEEVMMNGPLDVHVQYDDGMRFEQVGETDAGRILIVISTWRNERVRPITAWDAPRADKMLYLQHQADNEWLP